MKSISELWSVTCHIGSHNVSTHSADVVVVVIVVIVLIVLYTRGVYVVR